MALGQNLVAPVNIKIADKWVFTPLTLIIIGFDTHPYQILRSCTELWINLNYDAGQICQNEIGYRNKNHQTWIVQLVQHVECLEHTVITNKTTGPGPFANRLPMRWS